MSASSSTPSSWKCPLCLFFASRSLKGVVRHIGVVHSHDASFHIVCGLNGCPRSYRNFHSYKKHMFQRHRDVMEVGPARGESDADHFEPNEIEDVDTNDDVGGHAGLILVSLITLAFEYSFFRLLILILHRAKKCRQLYF